MFFTVWGHCISDNLKNVWFFQSEIYKKYFKDCPIVYVPMNRDSQDIKNFFKLLKILDIDINKCYPITTPIKFQNIIVPDPSMFVDEISGGRFFTAEYRETIDRIKNFAKKHSTPIADKKIYFSINRSQTGEERLAGYLKSKGYAVINPATLTFEDELNLLINCEDFVTTLGSSSHNTIFLNDRAKVLLIPRANYLTMQQTLNQVYDININYVDSTLSIFASGGNGSFCYIISDNLKKYFGDEVTGEYSDEDFLAFLVYFRNALVKKIQPNEKALQYYAPILPEFTAQLMKKEDLMRKVGIVIK